MTGFGTFRQFDAVHRYGRSWRLAGHITERVSPLSILPTVPVYLGVLGAQPSSGRVRRGRSNRRWPQSGPSTVMPYDRE
jgi:hypothetical protein